MKKPLLTTVVLLSVLFLHAQYDESPLKAFKLDFSLGGAIPQGAGSKGGGLFAIEPKYAIVDQFNVGLRIEIAVMARAFPYSDGTYSSTNVSVSGSDLATGDFYFTTTTFRPFIGAGGGLYRLASASIDDNGYSTDVASAYKLGAMIRAGFEVGHFRLAVEYNFVGNSAVQVTDNYGNLYSSTANNSYLGIKLGGWVGFGKL
jgi:hypothetical protein